ncbi:anti-sigma regulatory factor [Nodosilinea sp. LEGE 07298]|uniref:ATP-binding protein n=1 Tax=Nodosilinea sp. LEGE 07298 TaxID=2777970 RepID=UPI00187DF7AE|nr:anti-sigma regulatory factor [Nodosilinea sp. LEGE 07298]MBE9109456.1 anti-sigma regulatory factor [Nodosilinea sp. LEGE 07298]
MARVVPRQAPTQAHLQVASQLDVVAQVQRWFHETCRSLEGESAWVGNHCDRLALALTEGFTNAVRHAHAHLPPETGIDIDLALDTDQVEIRIWDYGDPFNPELLPEPQPGELLESGYGWFLLRRLADKVTYYRAKDGRNCLSIVKYGTCPT